MAFHALLITRDEDDIIAETLTHFLTWADEVHVFDTGSVDTTWDIVNELSVRDSRIRPVERRELWFSDHLRGYCFDKMRHRLRDGDWIVRTDSDEFYHIAPPEFVAAHLRRSETCVYQEYYDFRMTIEEAEQLSTREAINAERSLPICDRRHYYTAGNYPEPRMCKYRSHMSWSSNYTWPVNAGYLARKRLPIRHYPNRDPRQLQKRMELRRTMIHAGINEGRFARDHHWRMDDWREHLVRPGDAGVFYWKPGDDLPEKWDTKHLPKNSTRAVQRLLHTFAVRALDRLRYGRKPLYIPENLEPAVQEQLRLTMTRLVEEGC